MRVYIQQSADFYSDIIPILCKYIYKEKKELITTELHIGQPNTCLFLMFLDNVLSVFIKIYLHVDTIFIYIIFFRLFNLPITYLSRFVNEIIQNEPKNKERHIDRYRYKERN